MISRMGSSSLSRSQAILLLATAAVLFSTAGLMIKLLSIGPFALVGGRSIIAVLVILAWSGRPRFTWSLPQVGGGIALAVTQMLFVLATRQTTAANAVFIQFTAPVFVAIFGTWFLGERAQRIDWLAMLAIGIGFLFFFSGELSLSGTWGNINALLSGITLAWLLLFLRKQRHGSTVETILLGNAFAALAGLPFFLQESPTLADYGGILFLGVIQLGIPFILMSIAIKELEAVEAILIQTIEPLFNPIWVFLVVGEAPAPLALVGGVIVLASVTIRGVVSGRR